MPAEELPKILQAIADEIGVDAARLLARKCGGLMNTYVPRKPDREHPWAQAVGSENWAKICRRFGGRRISLPKGCYFRLKKRAILELAQDPSLSKRQIAQAVDATERYVYEVLQTARSDG